MSNLKQLLAQQKQVAQLESKVEVLDDKNLELRHQLTSLNDNLTIALDEKDLLMGKNIKLREAIKNMEATEQQYIQNQEDATNGCNFWFSFKEVGFRAKIPTNIDLVARF